MTGKERLVAAARGGEVDRKPVILWPGESVRSDARILIHPEAEAIADEERIVLVDVISPFGRAVKAGFGLNDLLTEDPEAGNAHLDEFVQQTRDEIEAANEAGFDGIFYRLIGAEPELSTPMQYGGYYLERDRELLEDVADARLNILYVDGGEEVYMDFVSDLPAHVFAWDIDRTGISVAAMRAMRRGALAAEDPTADILFADDFEKLEPWTTQGQEPSHV